MTGLEVSDKTRVYNNILGAIGHTPLVRLGRIAHELPCPLYAKLEFVNPGGLVKDRVGANIVEQADWNSDEDRRVGLRGREDIVG